MSKLQNFRHKALTLADRTKQFWLLFGLLCIPFALPLFANYTKSNNWAEVTSRDLLFSGLYVAFSALVLSLVLYKTFARSRLTGFVIGLFVASILGGDYEPRLAVFYAPIKAIFPITLPPAVEGIVVSGLFITMVTVLGWLLSKAAARLARRASITPDDMFRGLALAVGIVFVLQCMVVIPKIIATLPQLVYLPKNQLSQAAPKDARQPAQLPDIYYIVLDRYTNNAVLKDQFGFDNTVFTSFLESKAFSVDTNAKSNYPNTSISISSTLNARYHDDISQSFASSGSQTRIPYHRSIQYSTVIKELKTIGYKYLFLGSWYGTTNRAPLSDEFKQSDGTMYLMNHGTVLDPFFKQQLTNSYLARAIRAGLTINNYRLMGYSEVSNQAMVTEQLHQLSDIANSPSGGRFIFAHILSPHPPYEFNADGSISQYSSNDNIGEPIKQKYTNQISFINSEMTKTINAILEKSDGQAIVVLQADEGPYPYDLNRNAPIAVSVETTTVPPNMANWSSQELNMKYGILAAYHLPGVGPSEVEKGGNSVNIFRLILDNYFGYSLPYLPNCQFAYPEGAEKADIYVSITSMFSVNAVSSCSAQSSANQPAL